MFFRHRQLRGANEPFWSTPGIWILSQTDLLCSGVLCCVTIVSLGSGGPFVLLTLCLLGSSITHYCVAHEPFWSSYIYLCSANTLVSFSTLCVCVMSRYMVDSGRSSTSWYSKKWVPPANKGRSRKGSYSGWSRRDTRRRQQASPPGRQQSPRLL